MKQAKTFDCIDMKQAAQAQRAKEYAGLSDQEIAGRIQDELDTSDHPVAVWYRKVMARRPKTASVPRSAQVK